MPIQKDRESQSFVKMLYHNQPISDPAFAKYIAEELRLCITRSGMDDAQKIIVTHRLKWFRSDRLDVGSIGGSIETKSIRLSVYYL